LVAKGSAFHTGGDVWLMGSGPGSEAVGGFLDNTDIFAVMRAAIRGEP
jgi:alkaline phosphatase